MATGVRGETMNHIPVATGLVLCELVIVDEKTRNVTPVNCFSRWKMNSFPGSASFYVIAWLADGLGEMPMELIVNRLDTSDEVYRVKRRLRFDDPLKEMRFTARIHDCPFPVPGYYEIILIVDGESVCHRKIFAFS
jgi:hypothetical protein